MENDAIRARVGAVKEMAHAVASYGRSLNAAVSSAKADLNRAAAEFQTAVADSQRKLSAARRRREMAATELDRCRENCEPLRRQLAEAQVAEQEAARQHQDNQRALSRFDQLSAELLSSVRTAETHAESLIPGARAHIQEYAEILTDYLRTGVS